MEGQPVVAPILFLLTAGEEGEGEGGVVLEGRPLVVHDDVEGDLPPGRPRTGLPSLPPVALLDEEAEGRLAFLHGEELPHRSD